MARRLAARQDSVAANCLRLAESGLIQLFANILFPNSRCAQPARSPSEIQPGTSADYADSIQGL